MSPEEREEFIDSFRLKYQYNNGYQKLINLVKNTPNQPSQFKTKNWVEVNA